MRRLFSFLISEPLVIVVILINTATLLAMGFASRGTQGHDIACLIDYVCVVYFTVETVIKICTGGWKKYWSSGWNRFDFIVVLISTPVLLSPVMDVEALATVLTLRLGRLFRLFRLLRFIPNRDHLYQGVKRALRASVGVFLALLLINIVLSVGATILFGKYSDEHFGNPLLSSYSLFRVFTVEGWYEIPDAIAATAPGHIAILARVYFVGAVLVGGILGFSLANAVFVDEMTMDNNQDVEDKLDRLLTEVQSLRKQLNDRS